MGLERSNDVQFIGITSINQFLVSVQTVELDIDLFVITSIKILHELNCQINFALELDPKLCAVFLDLIESPDE